jgi:hypothetical protein
MTGRHANDRMEPAGLHRTFPLPRLSRNSGNSATETALFLARSTL